MRWGRKKRHKRMKRVNKKRELAENTMGMHEERKRGR